MKINLDEREREREREREKERVRERGEKVNKNYLQTCMD